MLKMGWGRAELAHWVLKRRGFSLRLDREWGWNCKWNSWVHYTPQWQQQQQQLATPLCIFILPRLTVEPAVKRTAVSRESAGPSGKRGNAGRIICSLVRNQTIKPESIVERGVSWNWMLVDWNSVLGRYLIHAPPPYCCIKKIFFLIKKKRIFLTKIQSQAISKWTPCTRRYAVLHNLTCHLGMCRCMERALAV